MRRILTIGVAIFLLPSFSVRAQETSDKNLSGNTSEEVKPDLVELTKKANISALIVGDYGVSLTDNVDINGKHNSEGVPSTNGFYLRYMRIQARWDLTKNISAQAMVNLADFKDNPQTKVLEIATVRYKFNNYATLQVGQFRPYFGREDMYAIDIHRSYGWSNQYSLFGRNNWMSFQLGAALYGSLQDKKIPLKYYYTFYNSNGKNQQGDVDNSKSHSFRLEYVPVQGVSLGANAAFGSYHGEATNAYGGDISFEKKINPSLLVGVDSEYKQGSNILAFVASKNNNKKADDFRMQGVYITPFLRWYTGDKKFFDAVEVSCRYEYLESLMENGNPWRSYSPMVSVLVGEGYQSKISIIGNLNSFNKQIPNSSQWDNNQFIVQYEFRY